jgi:hypothetical protein
MDPNFDFTNSWTFIIGMACLLLLLLGLFLLMVVLAIIFFIRK